ncbi:TlpA family protein disulfide reductase [Mycolicibacterium pulveris]|uniref:TlpA family protein disulfide reductase n=1 Tax=Mycolicibacterium pulveris TaxID=36813 RepID=UPI003CEDD281
MANPFTGEYPAAVHIAVRQINALLGTLHQNGDGDTPLKLMHSVSTRIGDPRRRRPDVGAFADWLVAYQRTTSGRGLADLRGQLTATAPPGAVRRFEDAFEGFDRDWEIELPPDVVRGRAKLQISSISVTVPGGSSTEVVIRAAVRAQYYPDPGTTELPPSVHGEVHATFDVSQIPYGTGRRLLIRPSAQDAKIDFIAAPGSGLAPPAVSRIAAEVRKFIREGVSLLPVDLPHDFAFADFKGIGAGLGQIIALPYQFSGTPAPPGGLQGLTQSFLGASGFGFAVSKEHVNTFIDVEAIRQAVRNRPPLTFTLSTIFGGSVSVKYRLRFSSGPTLTFKAGAIEIAGRVAAETDTVWAPNGFVSFKQRVVLVLDTSSQGISLERGGEPDVDESWFIPHSRATSVVTAELDTALVQNRPAIRRVFDDARNALTRGLRAFDAAASASYTAVDITPQIALVRGEIRSQNRRPPVVAVEETHGGAAFTALNSWVPAGTIERFVWTWVEHSHPASIWSGVQKTVADEHRFILATPAGLTNVSQVCLRIEGSQIGPSGQQSSVAAGTTCQVQEPEFAIDIPSWWGPVTVPIWRPDVADAVPLSQAIAGHASVAALPGDTSVRRNALVYFVDDQRDRPLQPLLEALRRARDSSSVAVVVVVSNGMFDAPRGEVERRLGLPREGLPAMHVTQDDEGGWTTTFGVSRLPSVYLINSGREFVWKHEGEPQPDEVVAALDKCAGPSAPSGFRALRLAVSPGASAPDIRFQDGEHQHALHRFRGRDVLLSFWQSWSAPCLSELQRLQQMHQGGRQAPFIIGVHGGVHAEAVDEIRKRLRLTYPLVQDHQQRIACRYGVRCWPTTIRIDADGRVAHVQFGTAHHHERLSNMRG